MDQKKIKTYTYGSIAWKMITRAENINWKMNSELVPNQSETIVLNQVQHINAAHLKSGLHL